jgi:hypothetical protein
MTAQLTDSKLYEKAQELEELDLMTESEQELQLIYEELGI